MAYPLVEQSGCRYGGGACALENAEVSLALAYVEGGIDLRASVPMDGVLMAIGPAGDERPPVALSTSDESGRYWRLALQERPGRKHRIRLVAQARGITWFGETGTAFLHAETDRGR